LLTGASGGIGTALATALAARGARLTLTGRRRDALDELAARVGGVAVAVDLSDPDAPAQLLVQAGRVDVLIANAALPASGQVTEYSVPEVDRAIDVNLRAPIVLAKLAAEQMAARGAGHLVFMSSTSGIAPSGQTALYSATKFGIRGFALALREDLRPHGVGVSVVTPGPIRDAGMLAETRVPLPKAVGTRTPGDVAAATIRAIDKNLGEVVVAPWSVRLSTLIGGMAPGFAAAVTRRAGGDAILAAVAEQQRGKR
jgi:short-subunit dehydrogenase